MTVTESHSCVPPFLIKLNNLWLFIINNNKQKPHIDAEAKIQLLRTGLFSLIIAVIGLPCKAMPSARKNSVDFKKQFLII